MRYQKTVPVEFVSRPNRFIARVTVEGREETVHVKNTGRCKADYREYITESQNP